MANLKSVGAQSAAVYHVPALTCYLHPALQGDIDDCAKSNEVNEWDIKEKERRQ